MRRGVVTVLAIATLLMGAPAAQAWVGQAPSWSVALGSYAVPYVVFWSVDWNNVNVWEAHLDAVGPDGATFSRDWVFDHRAASGHVEGSETVAPGTWTLDFYVTLPNGQIV